jgi:Ca-activated chloride channel family protein
MTTWSSLWAFLFLIPLFLVLGWQFLNRKKSRPSVQFSTTAELKTAAPTWKMRFKFLPQIFYLAGLVLVIVALARPQKADTKVKKNVDGIDIMMVLDVSESMFIEDMKPNRIEACKAIMEKFVQGRVSDRIGFIIFAGESYTRVPLTLDYKLLVDNIKSVQLSHNVKDGTAIGMALANAAARLKDSTARSRVIVFLTDGENNSGTIDPETALEVVKGYGLKIYTIGAGVNGDAQLPIETEDIFGRKVKRYQPIHSTVNDELLGKMASETGGKYYRATNNDALSKVFSDINRLEKTKIDVNQYVKYSELFMSWLSWGIIFIFVGRLLSETVFRRVP